MWYFIFPSLGIFILWSIPKIRTILKDKFPELIYSVASYFHLIADIKSSSSDKLIGDITWAESNLFLIIIGVLFLLLGFYLSHKKSQVIQENEETQRKLKREIRRNEKIKEEYIAMCSNSIKEIFEDFFRSASANGNSRVSLYKHKDNKFFLLGRHSDNPQFSKRGLGAYPDNEGFIAKGWSQGEFKIHSIPAWKGKGASYKSFMKQKCRITDDRINRLTMKSRSFLVYRFNSDSTHPHGIIVFETLKETEINRQIIGNIFATHETQIIALLKSMNSLL